MTHLAIKMTATVLLTLAAVRIDGGAGLQPAPQPPTPAASASAERRLARTVLEDKIRGGWAGQMIGVAYGAPTEFRSNRRIIVHPLEWTPDRVSNALQQDDLYVEMTFAHVLDTIGLDATTEQFGEMFKDSQYTLWHANAAARRLLNHGVKAPQSGHPRYNVHANDIDFQIEADFIGLMTPGLPQVANQYADRVGRVMNHGDGLYGGMFVAGMYAAAFFESNPRAVVEAGLRSIPAASGYARVIRDVLDWSAATPGDWRETWRRITDKWDRDDPCPDGALADFNIDASLNGAFIALGLLYGEGDVAKTLEISTRAGQDSDCNPSNALGVLGVILGYARMPSEFTSGIPALADKKFEYTTYSLNEIVQSSVSRSLEIVKRAGGRVTPTEIIVPVQEPKAAAELESWNVDPPTARLDSASGAWTWSPAWENNPASRGRAAVTSAASAEATLRFHGTGVAIMGRYTDRGGRADVWLDGKPAGTIDAWQVPRTNDNTYWHVTGLTSGEHTVRIVTRADRHPQSTGTRLAIEAAITYGR
jgi:hypothetical protein